VYCSYRSNVFYSPFLLVGNNRFVDFALAENDFFHAFMQSDFVSLSQMAHYGVWLVNLVGSSGVSMVSMVSRATRAIRVRRASRLGRVSSRATLRSCVRCDIHNGHAHQKREDEASHPEHRPL
jgi:hypothetical protein